MLANSCSPTTVTYPAATLYYFGKDKSPMASVANRELFLSTSRGVVIVDMKGMTTFKDLKRLISKRTKRWGFALVSALETDPIRWMVTIPDPLPVGDGLTIMMRVPC